mmetsp:Transcript_10621/g.32081  ORF Transcript_10621/g.32081 Transcript_10621/m.32081 type:complete len:191 (-) Transcript_10621:3537-4109(-)
MLLFTDHAGTVHVLPAVPSGWSDVIVDGLRADGGVDVTAALCGGALVAVELRLDIGKDPIKLRLRLQGIPGEAVVTDDPSVPLEALDDGSLEVGLEAGQRVVLTTAEHAGADLDELVAPVAPLEGTVAGNFWGFNDVTRSVKPAPEPELFSLQVGRDMAAAAAAAAAARIRAAARRTAASRAGQDHSLQA